MTVLRGKTLNAYNETKRAQDEWDNDQRRIASTGFWDLTTEDIKAYAKRLAEKERPANGGMMNDKKGCKNCGRLFLCEIRENHRKGICRNWRRDPNVWTSVPPTEPGWYWCRGTKDAASLFHIGAWEIAAWKNLKQKLLLQFQGPVTPKRI